MIKHLQDLSNRLRDSGRYTAVECDLAAASLVDEAIAALTWQPIATAPHSGIAILLWQPWKSGRDCTVIGHYANGWVDRYCEEFVPEPTHWMPLPSPPDQPGREP